eukprot:1159031-Pelagomonas_calceolata.AAC.2
MAPINTWFCPVLYLLHYTLSLQPRWSNFPADAEVKDEACGSARYDWDTWGVVCMLLLGMSTYLPLWEEDTIISPENRSTPILICHGDDDQGVSGGA